MKTKLRYIARKPRLFTYVLMITIAAGISPLYGLSNEGLEDEGIPIENWMTAPFESTFSESELLVENWMTAPFESTFSESELLLEKWMTAPFERTSSESEMELFVEEWMTAPF